MKIERSIRLPFQKALTYSEVEKIGDGALERPIFSAETTNISKTGIHVKTNRLCNPGERFVMTIYSGKMQYRLKGIVSWAKRAVPGTKPYNKHEMGIKFSKVPNALLDVYNDMIASGFGCLAAEV